MSSSSQCLVPLPSYLSCRAEELLPNFPDIALRRQWWSRRLYPLWRQEGFPRFHVKTHPEKLAARIWGSVSVSGERRSNKYLCEERLDQSADVGVMNGPSGAELMNHCLCCTRSIQQEGEHQLNIRWGNQNYDCSLKSPLKGFSVLLSAGVVPGSYSAPCWIPLKGDGAASNHI